MLNYINEFNIVLGNDNGPALYSLGTQPKLYRQITEAQQDDDMGKEYKKKLSEGETIEGWALGKHEELRFKDRLYVPSSMRQEAMKEFHNSRFVVHPGGAKMYQDLKRQCWWSGMKRDVVVFVSKEKENTKDLEGYWNHYRCQYGSGKT